MLKQRLGALRQGPSFALAEGRVTFDSLAQDPLKERKLRGADPKAQETGEIRGRENVAS